MNQALSSSFLWLLLTGVDHAERYLSISPGLIYMIDPLLIIQFFNALSTNGFLLLAHHMEALGLFHIYLQAGAQEKSLQDFHVFCHSSVRFPQDCNVIAKA